MIKNGKQEEVVDRGIQIVLPNLHHLELCHGSLLPRLPKGDADSSAYPDRAQFLSGDQPVIAEALITGNDAVYLKLDRSDEFTRIQSLVMPRIEELLVKVGMYWEKCRQLEECPPEERGALAKQLKPSQDVLSAQEAEELHILGLLLRKASLAGVAKVGPDLEDVMKSFELWETRSARRK
ncbi:MAG: hypothetical protein WCO52_05625 [bacterium]